MKFGFVVPNNFGIDNPQAVVELGIHAERLGFDSVWVNHHVLNVGYVRERLGTRPYHDALITLTWLAARTEKVRLGTSVLVLPYLHPMVLAKEIATLDQLSGGRLMIGVGVGSLPDENAALGVPYERRGAYSNESIEVMRALWTGEAASYSGEFFQFNDVISSPAPFQRRRVPIMVGGNRPAALRRVARLGDGWHPMNLPPESVAKRLPVIEAEAQDCGREPVATIQVRLDMTRLNGEVVAEYEAVGVTDLVVSLSSGDVDEIRRALDAFAGSMIGG